MSILKAIKDTIQGIPGSRSPKWQTVRKKFLAKNPTCALCDGKDVLEVHHIKPFHLHPELELDEKNLIVLCESKKNGISCHLAFGHLGKYESYNETVKEDVIIWNNKLKNRPKGE